VTVPGADHSAHPFGVGGMPRQRRPIDVPDDDAATGPDDAHQFGERGVDVAEVLEDLHGDRAVDGRVADRELRRLTLEQADIRPVAGLPAGDTAALLQEMASIRALHADALQSTITGDAWTRAPADWLESLETTLAASDDRYVRRIALAALVQSAATGGWTGSRRARLEQYRHDPAALVAEAAQFTFPPEELSPPATEHPTHP